jgi:integrase
MASIGIRTLANGEHRWRVQARDDGRMMQKTFLAEDGATRFKDMVERMGWQSAETVLEARKRSRRTPTLTEWTQKYLDPASGLLTGVEEGTRADYRTAADRSFLKILGEMPIDTITKADVGRWVAWQEQQPSQHRGKPVSMKTVQNYHSILSAVMRSAVEHKLRDDNPAWRTRITRGPKREGVFLTPEEFATILHFLPDYWTGFVMFLAGTGCRWGEATALTWGDLNLNSTPPTVRIDKAWKRAPKGQTVLKQPKSRRSNRTVSLTADVVEAMGEPRETSELIFPNRLGRKMDHASFRVNVWVPMIARAQDPELCEREGVAVLRKTPGLHDLRHSHASWLIAAGVPLPYVQARLGHESITTTVGTYGHLQPDAHVQMSDAIGRTLAGVRPLKQVE